MNRARWQRLALPPIIANQVIDFLALLADLADAVRMKNRLGLAKLVVTGVGVTMGMVACGSSSGGGGNSCSTPAACGGDVVGTWKVTSSCISISGLGSSADCPQETLKVSNITASGSVTYKSDMTYTAQRSLAADLNITLPSSCLTFQGITVTCAQLQMGISGDPNSGFKSINCVAAGAGCSCTGKIAQDQMNETGTFTTAGNVLTETTTGGKADANDYCVQGNTLLILPHMDMSMPMMGDLTGSGSITLTRQ